MGGQMGGQTRSRHFFVRLELTTRQWKILTTPKCPPPSRQLFSPHAPQKIDLSTIATMSAADDDSVSVSSLATPQPFNDDASPGVPPSRETYAELRYVSEGRSLKALAILSLGLKDGDGNPTFNPSVLPWSAALRPSALKMTANELRAEVTRRSVAIANVLSAPRPGKWTVAKATEWLVANPIVAEDEVAFIRATIAHRISVAERAGSQQPNVGQVASGNWIGKYPHLRLIHCIIDFNDIKTAYQNRLNVPSGRMDVENRKQPAVLAANVWHMVAAKWNDTSFQPVTSVKATHSDFARPISIPFDVVSNCQPATPEKVEEKWNAMNLALKRGIQNWERSGQGDGGHVNEDDNSESGDDDNNNEDDEDNDDRLGLGASFGSLKGRGRSALDLRRNFFDDKYTYLLYLWDVLDEHDLVNSTMQQLLGGIGSANGSTDVPSVIMKRKSYDDYDSFSSSKKNKEHGNDAIAFDRLSSSIEKHSNSLVAAAQIVAVEQEKNCIHERIFRLRDQKREMTLRMTTPGVLENQVIVDAIMQEIQGIEAEIAVHTDQINTLIATPTKNNRSPR